MEIEKKSFVVMGIILIIMGLSLVSYLSLATHLGVKKVSCLDKEKINEIVYIEGEIIRIKILEKIAIITIKTRECYNTIVFFNPLKKFPEVYNLYEGKKIAIIGEVKLYKNKREVVAKKIENVS